MLSVRSLTRRSTNTTELRILLLRPARWNGRHLAVEPILLVGKCRPRIRHAQKTIVCRLCFGPLGELEAVVGVIPEDLGLFHQHELGTEPTRRNRPYRIVTSAELSTAVRHWTSMRILLAMVLAFISTAPLADSTGERRPTGSTPTATETISDLYTFSRFQQGLLESTDLKGNAEVKNLAALRAEEAARRDKALKQISGDDRHRTARRQDDLGEREPGRARNFGRTDFRQKLLCRADSRV
ncbi:hypothetical protein ACVWZK_007587 [Bradyrhizobium sp. GM0.4]